MRHCVAAACIAMMAACAPQGARAADVLGVALGDPPGVAAAKLKQYITTTYGDYHVAIVTDRALARARRVLREGGTDEEKNDAHYYVDHSTIEFHQDSDVNLHSWVQFLAANVLPAKPVGDVDHERITVVFSGAGSGNVAFKVQRYVVFRPLGLPEVETSAPTGMQGMSIGVSVDAMRAALVAAFGTPGSETDTNVEMHEEPQSGGHLVGGDVKTLVYALDAGAGVDAAVLARCAGLAESADLPSRAAPDAPPVGISGCPALRVLRMYRNRTPLLDRFDEFLVDFPKLQALSDADAKASHDAEAAVLAIRAAGEAARKATTDAQMEAALHGPVDLRY